MQLNGLNLVDVASVYPYYTDKGLSLELLRLCNSQEFRFIDGYGKGHFIMTQTITSENVSFTVGSRTVSLKVLDRLSLEHPSHTGGLKVYITAEPKYNLLDTIVSRNYNVTIDKSIPLYDPTTIATLSPDCPAKTLQQIIADILPGGYSLTYSANTITPFDVAIEGSSVLKAIDHLCSIYGLIWTSTGSSVYVWTMEDPDGSSGSSDSSGSSGEDLGPINDIRYTQLSDSPTNINISFPVYEYARQHPKEYYTSKDSAAGQGQTLNIMDPYHPAIINTLGNIRNKNALDAVADIIIVNIKAIESSYDYVVKHHFQASSLIYQPISLSEVYGDFGAGPRSIYRSIPYPYIPVKIPQSKARYANNWRGTLTDGYTGVVDSFVVTPVVGLDGKKPPGAQEVFNIYGFDYGEAGWPVRVEWNNIYQQWEAIQQWYECPPDTSSASSASSTSSGTSTSLPYDCTSGTSI